MEYEFAVLQEDVPSFNAVNRGIQFLFGYMPSLLCLIEHFGAICDRLILSRILVPLS